VEKIPFYSVTKQHVQEASTTTRGNSYTFMEPVRTQHTVSHDTHFSPNHGRALRPHQMDSPSL